MIDRPAHPRRRRAFTLIESMATVAVLATLGSIASFVILEAVDGYAETATSAQLHAELSIAMDRAMREIRMIELNGSAATPPAPNITSIDAAGENMQWTDGLSRAYSLYKDGSDLKLEVEGGGAAVLLSDIDSFSVQTYDQDNGFLPNPRDGAADECDAIRRVVLNITCLRQGVTESLRGRVYIRSCMYGAQ